MFLFQNCAVIKYTAV